MAKEKLDNELYGMEGIKEQILLFLNTKLCNPNAVHANLGLVGPPGVGKTHIGRLIAEIMDWGFSQISFGIFPDFEMQILYARVLTKNGHAVNCFRCATVFLFFLLSL